MVGGPKRNIGTGARVAIAGVLMGLVAGPLSLLPRDKYAQEPVVVSLIGAVDGKQVAPATSSGPMTPSKIEKCEIREVCGGTITVELSADGTTLTPELYRDPPPQDMVTVPRPPDMTRTTEDISD